jgi:hypothetical protein
MRICRIQSSSRKDKFNLQLAIVGRASADEPVRRQLFSARPRFLLSFAPNSQQIREKQSAAALRISSLFVFISRQPAFFPDWNLFKAAAAWY